MHESTVVFRRDALLTSEIKKILENQFRAVY